MASRLNRVCFTGHRPDKLVGRMAEPVVKKSLSAAIDQAIADGYTTFISGMCPGVDIIAAELVIQKKVEHPEIHLIAAMPYPRFGFNWADGWGDRVKEVCQQADMIRNVSTTYTGSGVFQVRNRWMVDHASRLIAFWNGTRGGTYNTVKYGRQAGIQMMNYCKNA